MKGKKFKVCDQCFKNKIKCNKQKPACLSCVARHKNCSWDRDSSRSSCKDWSLPMSLAEAIQDLMGAMKKPAVAKPFGLPFWQVFIKDWMDRPFVRILFFQLVHLSEMDILKPSVKEQHFLAGLLNQKSCFKAVLSSSPLNIVIPFFKYEDILSRAADAFFHYSNPFMPLFTQYGYENYPRTPLLRLTVWRKGLEYMEETPTTVTLTHILDVELMKLTKLSQLKPTLDVLQSILLLIIGLKKSPLNQRFSLFHTIATVLPHQLGLHLIFPFKSSNIALERRLAYQYIAQMNALGAWKIGYPFFHLTHHYNKLSITPKTFAEYRERAQGSRNGLRDFCLLVSSESLFYSARLFLKVNQIYVVSQRKKIPSQYLLASSKKALDSLCYLSNKGIMKIYELSLVVKVGPSRECSFLPFVAGTSSDSYIEHMLLFLQIRYEVGCLLILKACSQADPNHPTHPVSERPLNFLTQSIEMGLSYAVSILGLLLQVTPMLFIFTQSAMISTASTFIIQHFHAYLDSGKTSLNLSDSLCQARSLWEVLSKCPQMGYHYEYAASIFRGMLVQYKIKLPNKAAP
ncbi:hypothetical protein DSO57_1006446 [Entomophthora muscae]|uniref:Uncharacterized protein n=1 Tax=Entomophthora muscae TaxID=34485 RepID=A0ACC2USL5_9FUNG|nr:hypothetical protein DSO57_1006446 [Entomophthora muscae]